MGKKCGSDERNVVSEDRYAQSIESRTHTRRAKQSESDTRACTQKLSEQET